MQPRRGRPSRPTAFTGAQEPDGGGAEERLPSLVMAMRTARRGARIVLHLEDGREVMISADAGTRLGVRTGTLVTPELFAQLERLTQVEDAHEVALRLLTVRDRSASEIKRRLHARGISAAVADGELARLDAAGLLNDRRFAQSYVADRERLAPRGKRLVRQELRARGIAADIADELTLGPDDVRAATDLARKRAARGTFATFADLQMKVGSFLARRGFDYGVSREALRAVWAERGGAGPDADESGDTDT